MATTFGQTGNVLPSSDADLSTFASSLVTAFIAGSPFEGVTVDAIPLEQETQTFNTLLGVATNPNTRTSVAIAAKNAARGVLEALLRQLYGQMATQYRATGDNSDLLSLGFPVPDLIRTPVAAPTQAPMLSFESSMPGLITLRVTQVDPDGQARSTRYYDRRYSGVDIQCRTLSGAWLNKGLSRRVILRVPTSEETGTVLQFRVRYVTRSGKSGPWSEPVNGTAVAVASTEQG